MMRKDIAISVFEVVGSPLCVASGDGQKVYERLASVLGEEHGAALSFHNVDMLTSAFLNTAIGQLYGKFSEERIRSSVSVVDMEPEDAALLKRVVETAKRYFKDPERFELASRDALEEDDADA